MSVGSLNGGVLSLSKLKVGGVSVIPGTVGGVQELVGLEGAITMSSPTATFVATGQNIEMTITYPTPPVESVGGLTGAITFSSPNGSVNITPAGTNIALEALVPPVDSVGGLVGAITFSSPNSSITITPAGTNIALEAVVPAVRQATYYKTTAQNLTSGNTDITFDATGSWNYTDGYITYASGTANFTVVQTGVYQLGFNATILVNNGTWATTTNRNIGIDITRSSNPRQAVIQNSALQGVQNYTQSTSGTYYLVAGDVINMRVGGAWTGGTPTPPQVQGLANTFDLNTFFTWTYISA